MHLAPQTPVEPYSSSHTLEQAVGAPDDAAKRFGRSAPLDAAAAERAGLRVKKTEGVACPPWWLPPLMADYGQVHSGTQVLVHIGIDDGKPHRNFMSDQSAEQLTPPDSPSRALPCAEASNSVSPRSSIAEGAETLNLWTSSALLRAFILLLSLKLSRREVRAMAADFTKEKKTRGSLATKAAIAMGVLLRLVVAMNAGLTAAIVFLSMDMKVGGGFLFLGALLIRAATRQRTRPRTPHWLRGYDASSNRSPCRGSRTGIGLRRWLPLGWLALASGFRLPEESGAVARIEGEVELAHGSPLSSPAPAVSGGEVDGARDRRRLTGSNCDEHCDGCDGFFGRSCDSECDRGCDTCITCSQVFGSSYAGSVSACHYTGWPSDHTCHLHCHGGKYRVGGGCDTRNCNDFHSQNGGSCDSCGADPSNQKLTANVWMRENGGACHDCAHHAPIELQAQGA